MDNDALARAVLASALGLDQQTQEQLQSIATPQRQPNVPVQPPSNPPVSNPDVLFQTMVSMLLAQGAGAPVAAAGSSALPNTNNALLQNALQPPPMVNANANTNANHQVSQLLQQLQPNSVIAASNPLQSNNASNLNLACLGLGGSSQPQPPASALQPMTALLLQQLQRTRQMQQPGPQQQPQEQAAEANSGRVQQLISSLATNPTVLTLLQNALQPPPMANTNANHQVSQILQQLQPDPVIADSNPLQSNNASNLNLTCLGLGGSSQPQAPASTLQPMVSLLWQQLQRTGQVQQPGPQQDVAVPEQPPRSSSHTQAAASLPVPILPASSNPSSSSSQPSSSSLSNREEDLQEQQPQGGDAFLLANVPPLPRELAEMKRKQPRGRASTFPRKLHQMLTELEERGESDIASFMLPHGRSFRIHKPNEFARDIMPNYFQMGTFSSFQRQLNLYNFQRITDGPERDAYFHELFVRGQSLLCTRIKRTKIKGLTRAKQEERVRAYERCKQMVVQEDEERDSKEEGQDS